MHSSATRPSATRKPLLTIASTKIAFFFNDTATTEIYTLSLHDALPIAPAEPYRLLRSIHHMIECGSNHHDMSAQPVNVRGQRTRAHPERTGGELGPGPTRLTGPRADSGAHQRHRHRTGRANRSATLTCPPRSSRVAANAEGHRMSASAAQSWAMNMVTPPVAKFGTSAP